MKTLCEFWRVVDQGGSTITSSRPFARVVEFLFHQNKEGTLLRKMVENTGTRELNYVLWWSLCADLNDLSNRSQVSVYHMFVRAAVRFPTRSLSVRLRSRL